MWPRIGKSAKKNVWHFPEFNSGEDKKNLTRLKVPASLKPNTSYLWRVRYKNNYGIWSAWSKPAPFITNAEFSSPVSKLLAGKLAIKDIQMSNPGEDNPLLRLLPKKWYQLSLYIHNAHGWRDNRFTVIWLHAHENALGNAENRGGQFNPANNYVINFSLQNGQVYEQRHTTVNITDTVGHYIDGRKSSLVLNAKQKAASINFRLLGNAEPGAWVLKGFVSDVEGNYSPTFQTSFLVVAAEEKSHLALYLLLSAAIIVLGIGFFVLRQKLAGAKRSGTLAPLIIKSENQNVLLAKEFIENHYKEPLSLKHVADALSISHDWLSKTFSQSTNMTLTEFINHVRVSKARALLEQGKLTVSQIAFEVGFNNQEHFHRTFKKFFNMTPKSFQKWLKT